LCAESGRLVWLEGSQTENPRIQTGIIRRLSMLYLAILAFFFVGYLFAREKFVTLEFYVQAPEYAPDQIYMVGSHELIGSWKEHKFALTRRGKYHQAVLRIERGSQLIFKFTLGNWDSVEQGKRFHEVSNRHINVEGDEEFHLVIHNFAGYESDSQEHTRVGDFEFLRAFESKILGNKRQIAIYLPPAYKAKPKKKFPVLYMHDGNNLFDQATAFMGVEWEVDETAQALIENGFMDDAIIVGVANTMARMDEYTPCESTQYGGGRGDDYLRFLSDELMPVINRKFRTKTGPKNTGIMGSSLGGLISLYAAIRKPEVFGLIGSISPSLWWADRYMANEFVPSQKKPEVKIWMDMGTREGMSRDGVSQALKDTREMSKILEKMGFNQGEDLFYFEHKGAAHDEASWSSRIHMPLLYFFGKPNVAIELQPPFGSR